jgi:hypothetical protein
MTAAETPAHLLHRAATHLRQLATADQITPGPWLSMDHGDRLLWDGPGADDLPPRYVVDEPMSNAANAAYIAAMHPGVGVALAAWLDEAAVDAEMIGPDPHAVATARALLGEDAQP